MLRTAKAGVLLAVLALLTVTPTGCGRAADRGPAWPKPAASETDGGESLEPRQPDAVAAIEDADDASPAAAAPKEPGAAPAAPAATPGARSERPADAPAAREPDVLTTEDIIIEIDD
jgi:hypothetical protein